ncbi:MAG: hypothetical protein AAGA81_22575 [Acidobacteriota bacterium]
MTTASSSSRVRSAREDAAEFDALLAEIDELIVQHETATQSCSRGPAETGSHLLAQVDRKATQGLERFPRNGELLRRRAYATCRLSPNESVRLLEAQEDLQEALQYEPTNLRLALDLMGELFAFDGLEDEEVAKVAAALAEQAEQLMLEARALQIRALLFAQRTGEAADLTETWQGRYPDSDELKEAVDEFECALIP